MNEKQKYICRRKGCDREFPKEHGRNTHERRAHGRKSKLSKKSNAAVGAIQVAINFCSHCGHRIPNAYVVAGAQ